MRCYLFHDEAVYWLEEGDGDDYWLRVAFSVMLEEGSDAVWKRHIPREMLARNLAQGWAEEL